MIPVRIVDRAAVINIGCATVFASWCSGWLWALLELTRPYPGIFTFKGDRGAYELVELPTGLPFSLVLAAFFAISLLVALVPGMARRWLDPERESWSAVRWAFGSRSLNIAVATLLLFGIVSIATNLLRDRAYIGVTIMIVTGLSGMLLPFLAWNAQTLSRPALMRWWRPAWPGWFAIVATVVLQAGSVVMGWGSEAFSDAGAPSWMKLFVEMASWIVDFFLWLVMAVVWLDHGRRALLPNDLRRVVRWPVLGLLLWQDLLLLSAAIAFLVPVLLIAVLAIYVIPQYEAWAQSQGQSLSEPLRMVASVARAFSDGSSMPVFAFALAFGAYSLLAQGRLLVGQGVGAGLGRSGAGGLTTLIR